MCSPVFVLPFFLLIGNAVAGLESENIIGGLLAKENQFKYQISLQVRDQNICGGALIASYLVITAANCFYREEAFKDIPYIVVAGTINHKNVTRSHFVEKVYIPKSYVNGRPYHDIAVARLENNFFSLNEVESLPNIGVASLPKNNEDIVEKKLTVLGFGWDTVYLSSDIKHIHELWSGASSGVLRYAPVDIEKCEISDPTMICGRVRVNSEYTPDGVCKDDSGSPLVTSTDKIVGILSDGHSTCDQLVQQTHYTKVAKFINLIENAKTDQAGDDTNVHVIKSKLYRIPSLKIKAYTSSPKIQAALQYLQDNHPEFLRLRKELRIVQQLMVKLTKAEVEVADVKAKLEAKEKPVNALKLKIIEEYHKLNNLMKTEKMYKY